MCRSSVLIWPAGNQLTIRESVAKAIGLTAGGVTADNGGSFAFDVARFRKLSLHDADADVSLDFAGIAPEQLHVSARTAAVVSRLEGKDLRLIGAEGVAVNADVFAAIGGSVATEHDRPRGRRQAWRVGGGLDHRRPRQHCDRRGGPCDRRAGHDALHDRWRRPRQRRCSPRPCRPAGRSSAARCSGPAATTPACTSPAATSRGSISPGANLTGANLAGANLSNSNLTGVVLEGASLAGADKLGNKGTGITGTPRSLAPGWSLAGGSLVRTTLAAATGIELPSAGVYPIGTQLSFTVTFAEAVAVTSRPSFRPLVPTLQLDVGTATRSATYVADRSTATQLVFVYTIQGDDVAPNGLVLPRAITLPDGASLQDLGHNATSLTLPAADGSGIQLANQPAAMDAAFSAPGYRAGQAIQVAVNFTRSVTVTGIPQIPLLMNSGRTATYVSGSGTGTLVFQYLVRPGDASAGVSLGAAIDLPAGATITDSQGTASALVLPAAFGPAPVVDTVAPAIIGVGRPAAGWYGVGGPGNVHRGLHRAGDGHRSTLHGSLGRRPAAAGDVHGWLGQHEPQFLVLCRSRGLRGDRRGREQGGPARGLLIHSGRSGQCGPACPPDRDQNQRSDRWPRGHRAASRRPCRRGYRAGSNLVFRVTFRRPVL